MNTPFSLTTTVAAGRHQVSCDLAGEAVILQLQDGVYYGLNPVGARVWQLLKEPRTVGDIMSRILDEYDVDPSRCEQDLSALLLELSSKKLIEVRHDGRQEVSGPPGM
jgi:hypothetical protein